MNDLFLPPAVSAAGVALRSNFGASAVERAVAELAAEAIPGTGFFPGFLPDNRDGVGIRAIELPETREPHLGRKQTVLLCSGRSAAPEFFARFAALFPLAERESNGVHFHTIEQQGSCLLGETVHHGILKRTAELKLLCSIDLTQSEFPSVEPSSAEATPEMWAAIRPAAVETALAEHLGISPGFFPAESAGKSIRTLGSPPLVTPEWRDFVLELSVHAIGNTEAVRELAQLLANYPKENFTANNIDFHAVWQEGAVEFEPAALYGQNSIFAKAKVTARVNSAASHGAGNIAPSPNQNRNVSTFDPAALERALAARIAAELALAPDRELCRGEFPPPGCAVTPVAAVRLTGAASGNRETGWHISAQLRLRAPHRDELFRRMLAFDALFPRYDEPLGEFTCRAILKRDFNLDWQEQNGRNVLTADLALELIL